MLCKNASSILVVVDRLSKEEHIIPCEKMTANYLANVFVSDVVRLHGLPKSIVTDRGTQFTSEIWKEVCRMLGIKQSLTSAFHPQSQAGDSHASGHGAPTDAVAKDSGAADSPEPSPPFGTVLVQESPYPCMFTTSNPPPFFINSPAMPQRFPLIGLSITRPSGHELSNATRHEIHGRACAGESIGAIARSKNLLKFIVSTTIKTVNTRR